MSGLEKGTWEQVPSRLLWQEIRKQLLGGAGHQGRTKAKPAPTSLPLHKDGFCLGVQTGSCHLWVRLGGEKQLFRKEVPPGDGGGISCHVTVLSG